MSDIPNNDIAIFGAIASAVIALGYKFLRIIKSDRTADTLDNEETAFRLSLREEVKELRESNCKLTREKLEILERAIKAEAQLEHIKQKCLECRYRLAGEEHND